MSKNCNCRETNDFMAQVRKAYAEKKVLWQIQSGYLISGPEDQAKQRLENGKIECYIVPMKNEFEITFKTVDTIPKPKNVPEKKATIIKTKSPK